MSAYESKKAFFGYGSCLVKADRSSEAFGKTECYQHKKRSYRVSESIDTAKLKHCHSHTVILQDPYLCSFKSSCEPFHLSSPSLPYLGLRPLILTLPNATSNPLRSEVREMVLTVNPCSKAKSPWLFQRPSCTRRMLLFHSCKIAVWTCTNDKIVVLITDTALVRTRLFSSQHFAN